ncbi:alanine--tRNA ligase [Flavobacteriaceae bacterium]|jgi:alanyl-tRNA synthetase|nr:alanine--tRNA ligase [Flavobacteriaceae bacterium]MDB4590440.1 alanine--tRNA ligase [Flavobacteriaceae bacterium]
MTSKEIRSKYLDFFKSKSHSIVDSAPMILKNDPTLMFVNAGMVPFKEYFLGQKKITNKRVADSQKCLRVSGKHNDLEEVGKDTYHHTMFEMLGNWSFGDYFKKEAINWAWEFLTEVLKIDKNNLYVSVFEGAKEDDLAFDQEAYDIWKDIIDEDRIINGNKQDNFWEMGAQGPCGPCSEIHVDIRSADEKAQISGKSLVNKDHPQVVEIWNLVFMEFNRKANGTLEKLPHKHVDTGMGFERLCMVMQNVSSNYDTDVFMPLIKEIETITNTTYGNNTEIDIAIRVISDHVRAVAFAIADGQLPSNTGAGYVIRRILRRAVRYGFTFLGTKKPFIYQLADTLTKQMGTTFPELLRENKLISIVIKEEEHSFLTTLDQGLVLLENVIQNADSSIISGKKAFEMYDTFGFPKDLTALILRERGLDLDETEFESELEKQKERSRSATKVETGDWVVLTEDDVQEFIGYDYLETNVKIARYRKTKTKKHGEFFQVVFNLTPFYPEGGGQEGDKGYLESSHGDLVYIIDTKKENNLVIHYLKNLPKDVHDTFKAVVDKKIRSYTEANHSATHLLHQALRAVLGTHVTQKGSMVHSRGLRFDFSHFSKVTSEELIQVENFVNARIREGLSLKEKRNIPLQVAMDEGAIALFGEKYGDTVRTIKFGGSMELCGGTHVENTKDIWHFILLHEGAVASGVRRIEAITGEFAKDFFISNSNKFKEIKKVLQNTKDPLKSIVTIQEENSDLKKQIQTLLKEKGKNLKTDLKNDISEMNGVNFLAKQVDLDANGIKDISFELGGEFDNLFLLLGTNQNGKALLSCYISKGLVTSKNLDAGKIIRELGKYIQGGGGGQPFFATAGGKNPDGLSEALSKGKDYIF